MALFNGSFDQMMSEKERKGKVSFLFNQRKREIKEVDNKEENQKRIKFVDKNLTISLLELKI